ncbi:hypothetical protein PN36_24295 [Candidatus Thiomargarita nelsonii]|uniref:Uncharacterized protein n=1 Tax=Candidatus Thiomargarita nelsonii TaxID=1003181 RepID=A0A4E0QRT2_9GAMM|nr:hypothetical protein PN36_31270 [Candidatus Thiomargarita nelsonii]TGO02481.1 hypothetical protein PN36_24295 [Candidatus Thiomargarita nelsonii]
MIIQREDGKGMELDVVAESNCGRVVLIARTGGPGGSSTNWIEESSEIVGLFQLMLCLCVLYQ